ncbi:MAG: glycosyltransferase family 4 protein [Synechococcaceae cyanobacterium]|nr:glycosyltransferase family 4 protein [Synechococcaceae cyanobacterium]
MTSLPRVGYVLKMYPRFSETFIVSEILALERQGLSLEILSLRAPVDSRFHSTLAEVQAPVRYLPSQPFKPIEFWQLLHSAAAELPGLWAVLQTTADEDVRDVYQAIHVALLARRGGLQHLHAHFATLATTVARLAAAMAGITYSFTAHAKDIFHDSVEPAVLERCFRDAAHAVTISRFNHAYLRETLPQATERLAMIYNGLDLSRYPYRDPSTATPSLIAVGRLVEKKGFDVLLEACSLLQQQGDCPPVTLIGSGPLEQELAARIEQLGLQGTVQLLGPRTHAEIIADVSGASVFVAPCVVAADGNRDGLPTVLLEAMALGTPCISTDVTGIPEVIEHERTGLLVPQRDGPALAQAIRRLLCDQELARRLAQQARLTIDTHFDIDRNAAAIRDLYARLAAPAAAAQR